MHLFRKKYHILVCLSVIFSFTSLAQETTVTADSVKAEFLHAWNGYKQYAWGSDALKPVSKKPSNWFGGVSLCVTPVDAYDALLIMGLTKEAAEAKQLIFDSLSFDKDASVELFEVNIRLVGGLISAYQMDGDKRFLTLAEDLAKRLLPAFNTPTGMPYRFINLKTAELKDSISNPAEIGTLMLEFGSLSKLTGNQVYYQKAKRALVQLYHHRSKIGLVGSNINVITGEWTDTTSHIGGGIDSYYEYLQKAWLLFGETLFKKMADESIKAVEMYIADTTHNGLWYGVAEIKTGKRLGTEFGSLEAFYPAMLCLRGSIEQAARLQDNCYKMWQMNGIEPEEFDYVSMKVTSPGYYLRPEIIESAYYLYHYTGDKKYVTMGETFYHSLVQYCKTDAGYTTLKDVRTKKQSDGMQSYFFTETLKYLYILLSPKETFQFDSIIFTTEAHPIKKTW